MSTIILKVQLNEEIRRVSLNVVDPLKLVELEAKVIGMFPQLQDFVMMMRNPSTEELQPIFTDSELEDILSLVRTVRPPILRISIIEGQKRPQVTLESVEIVNAPEILLERAELRVHSADEEEVEEEGDDEEEEEIEVEEVEREGEDGSTSSGSEDNETESKEPDSICSFCRSYIGEDSCFEKVRFKCVNCVDVLCDYCEEQGVHDPSHLLVKLRIPVSRLPLKQQIVFVSHIEDHVQRLDARLKRKELRQALKNERREKRKQERLNAKKARKLARQAERKSRRKERKRKEQEKQLAAAMSEAQAQLEEFAVAAHVLAEAVQAPEEAQPQEDVAGVNEEDLTTTIELEASVDPLSISQYEEVIKQLTEEIPDLVENGPEIKLPDCPAQMPQLIDSDSDEECEDSEEFEEENAEDIEEEEWNVSSMMEGFQVVAPGQQAETGEVDLNAHRIQGLAFREKLLAMEQMGFGDRNRNIYLLLKNFASLEGAVAELVSS